MRPIPPHRLPPRRPGEAARITQLPVTKPASRSPGHPAAPPEVGSSSEQRTALPEAADRAGSNAAADVSVSLPPDPIPSAAEGPSDAASGVRVGSPFGEFDVPTTGETEEVEGVAEAGNLITVGVDEFTRGVQAETARGGAWAAVVLIVFAALTLPTFPLGTLLISGLGAPLGVFGLSSPRSGWALAAILAHLVLFVWAFRQWSL